MHDFTGTSVADRYLIERELGRGGMATVWCARDLRYERFVAIKILHPALAGAIASDRFVREVRLTAQLQHPNIVPILDSGVLVTPDGTSLPWYAMGFLDGESLRSRLAREHQLSIDESLKITEAAASALLAAHQLGVVHRDIKPENVFLSNGHVYVVDFGIAKALIETGVESLTASGLAVGTSAYMSPEQATGDHVDGRSDQYSLATMLYEMLAGDPPFSGSSAQSVVARRLAEPARPLRTVRSTVPEPVERAILKALERAPADRFPDMREFCAALRANAPTDVFPARDRQPRRRTLSALAVLAAVLIIVWIAGIRSRAGDAPKTPKPDPAVVALYERGTRAYDRRTPNGITDAIASFSAALRRDSAYAPAWTGLAKSYARAYMRGFDVQGLTRDSLIARALAASENAFTTDSGSSDVWVTRAMVNRIVDPTNLAPARRYARRAVDLDSGNAAALHALAVTHADMGNMSAALASWQKCVQLAPAFTECLAFLGLGHYWRRHYDSAAVWADSAVALDPNYLLGRQVAANVAIERGDFSTATAGFDAARRVSTGVEVVNSLAGAALAEARAGRAPQARNILRRAESLAEAHDPMPLHTAVYLAQAHAALGETVRAMHALMRYEPVRDLHFQLHLRCDPPFDPLRDDKRFTPLLVRAPLQETPGKPGKC